MNWLLMALTYFTVAVAATVILIRMRPEWLLRPVTVVENGELASLTLEEKRDYYRMMEYKNLYPSLPALIIELTRLRRNEDKVVKYRWEFGGDTIVIMALSPFLLVLGVPASIGIRGAVNSVNNTERLRVSVEKELASAKNEIDDFLRSEK